jgi:hypothetical protein
LNLVVRAERLPRIVVADPHADGDVRSNPINHASVLSSTVPVLPASGHVDASEARAVPAG